MSDPLIPVEVGACRCPGAPHPDGDIVYLRPTLSLHGGMVAQRKIIDLAGGESDSDEIMASLAEVFCRYGVVGWTFTDERGPVDVTPEAIQERLLDDFSLGFAVSDKAADLYSSGLIDPLRERASKSLQLMQTSGSTSAPNGSSDTPRKRSRRSSTTTTPTDATATTSA
jgi:hypothetical protein